MKKKKRLILSIVAVTGYDLSTSESDLPGRGLTQPTIPDYIRQGECVSISMCLSFSRSVGPEILPPLQWMIPYSCTYYVQLVGLNRAMEFRWRIVGKREKSFQGENGVDFIQMHCMHV